MGGSCRKQSLFTEVEELSAEGEHTLTYIPCIISLSSCVEQDKQVNSWAQSTPVPFLCLGTQDPSMKFNNIWVSSNFPHMSKGYGRLFFSPVFSSLSHTCVCVCKHIQIEPV